MTLDIPPPPAYQTSGSKRTLPWGWVAVLIPILVIVAVSEIAVYRWLTSRDADHTQAPQSGTAPPPDLLPIGQLSEGLPADVGQNLEMTGESNLDVTTAASLARDGAPGAGEALVASGFVNGYLRTWSDQLYDRLVVVDAFVLQFDDPAGAAAHELRMQRRLPGKDTDNNPIAGTEGGTVHRLQVGDTEWNRISLLRGPRVYYLYEYVDPGAESAPTVAELAERLAATAA